MSNNSSEIDAAKERRATFSLPKVIASLIALLVAGMAIFMTLGPKVDPPGVVVLDNAFVHGAVAHVGIARDARVERLHVDLGDIVAPGDTVATLEGDHLKTEVEIQEARLARMREEIIEAEIAAQTSQEEAESRIAEAEAEVAAADARKLRAEANVELREAELERAQTLHAKGIASDVEIEKAQVNVEAARAEVKRQEAELKAASSRVEHARATMGRAEAKRAETDVLRARVQEAEAKLARAKNNLERTNVKTEVGGVIVDVATRPGASVRPADAIVSVWNTERIWMQAWVSEERVAGIPIDAPALIEVDALPGQFFEGRVRRILVSEDGQERTLPGQPISPLLPEQTRFAVQVSFKPDAEALGHLLPGMSGKVRISRNEESLITEDNILLSLLRKK